MRSSICKSVFFGEGLLAFAVFSVINVTPVLEGWDRRSGQVADQDGGVPRTADDPRLIGRIQRQLRPPSLGPLNLTLRGVTDQSQHGVPEFVLALTSNKTGGFFVECGAFDGETMSTTLSLERQHGWTGLLMEPARQLFAQMVTKRRAAWLLDACISDRPYAYTASFQELKFLGTIKNNVTARTWSDSLHALGGLFYGEPLSARQEYGVACYPLSAVLAALDVTSVDFFSLDVEGVEMGVLAGIPWEQVDIKIVVVEVYLGTSWNPQFSGIIDLMESNGYIAEPLYIDWIFVKKKSEFARDALKKIRELRTRKFSSLEWKPPHENPVITSNTFPYSKWNEGTEFQEYKVKLKLD